MKKILLVSVLVAIVCAVVLPADVAFLVSVSFAAVVYTLFAVIYGAGIKWEETPEGRGLFASTSAKAALAWLYVINRADEILAGSWAFWTLPARAVGWFVLGLAGLWHLRQLASVQCPQKAER